MSGITRVYLGNPSGPFGMQALPEIPIGSPIGGSGGMSPVFSRGGSVQQLLSGGAFSTRKPKTKSTYPIQWKLNGPSDMDTLMSFYDGGQGPGPYCLVDPSQDNFLPPNVARMGAVLGAVPEWSPAAGAVAVNAAQAPPAGILSGVMGWTGAVNTNVLYMGLNNLTDGTWCPPVIPGLSHGGGLSCKLLSGSGSLTAALMYGVGGLAPAGAATATAATAALNTSTWVDVSAIVAAGFAWPSTADYAFLRLTLSGATSASILLSAPWFTYSTTTAAKPNPWMAGIGVPRCVIVGDAPSPVGRPTLRDFTMTMQEA